MSSSPRITAGERRGLIVLLIVIIIATVLLCWRDRTVAPPTPEPSVTYESIPAPIPDSNATNHPRRKSKRRAPKATSPAPSPRSPRDEQVN